MHHKRGNVRMVYHIKSITILYEQISEMFSFGYTKLFKHSFVYMSKFGIRTMTLAEVVPQKFYIHNTTTNDGMEWKGVCRNRTKPAKQTYQTHIRRKQAHTHTAAQWCFTTETSLLLIIFMNLSAWRQFDPLMLLHMFRVWFDVFITLPYRFSSVRLFRYWCLTQCDFNNMYFEFQNLR